MRPFSPLQVRSDDFPPRFSLAVVFTEQDAFRSVLYCFFFRTMVNCLEKEGRILSSTRSESHLSIDTGGFPAAWPVLLAPVAEEATSKNPC